METDSNSQHNFGGGEAATVKGGGGGGESRPKASKGVGAISNEGIRDFHHQEQVRNMNRGES